MSSGPPPNYFVEVDRDFYQCPYQPHHHVLKHRIRNHAINCRKNNPWADIILCEYNPHHHIRYYLTLINSNVLQLLYSEFCVLRSSEYADHRKCCKDKFELDLVRASLKFPVKIPSFEMFKITTGEDWNVNCYPSLEPQKGSTGQRPLSKLPLTTDEVWN